MTTLSILTSRLGGALDITEEAAEFAINIHLQGLSAKRGEKIDPENIDDEDAATITSAIKKEHADGALGQGELQVLSALVRKIERLNAERDPQILAALAAGARAKDVADVVGVSVQQIYNIKNGSPNK